MRSFRRNKNAISNRRTDQECSASNGFAGPIEVMRRQVAELARLFKELQELEEQLKKTESEETK